ncbi:MAG: HAD hydrolase family protein [Candidatus Aminicenantes bacterium]|nr:HAD hydrolase family protein [Candidatus Aminicenantes bacterium]
MIKNKDISTIKALVLDIDGVLTDGTANVQGPLVKRIFLRDLDALTMIRKKGVKIAFLTGESEDDARPVVDRCGGGLAVYNAKDKEAGISEIARLLDLDLIDICYVGDARRDVPVLKSVGFGLCPADGDKLAKEGADRILMASGGRGAVSEAVDLLLGI